MSDPRARRSTHVSGSVAGAAAVAATPARRVGARQAVPVAGGVGARQATAGSFSDADLDAAFDRYERTGRGAGGGGGRGSGPAARPPGRKRRDPLWARLFIWFGALLMLVSGAAIVGGKVLLYEATSGVEKAPLLGGAGGAQGAKALKGPLNILMVG